MVSRKNLLEKIHKIEEKHEHHSIRKFTMGAASVLVGLTFMGSNSRPVKASKSKKNESEIVLVENQGTESEATEQNIINQYTTNSESNNNTVQTQSEEVTNNNPQTNTLENGQQTETKNNLNNQSASGQTQESTSSSPNQVTNEETPSKDNQTETKPPTYQESQDKVNDINNSINDDLKNKVEDAKDVPGVTVDQGDTNKVTTGTTDIDKNADKIREENQKQIEEIEKQLAEHKANLEKYNNDLAKYEVELAEYTKLRNDYIAKLKELGLWKEGNVDPSDISQELVLDKEENAVVNVVISDNHAGSVTKGDETILKDENGNPLLMHHYLVKDNISGDFLTVIYTNLENSTYKGEHLGKIEVVYSDFTISNNSYQGNSQSGIYFGKSPTDGFFYRKADGVTIELKMYDRNGNRINLNDNTAYVTVGSLNNGSSSTSHKEYVEKAEIINGDGHKGEGVALPESSVTIHHGPNGDILYADKDNEVLHDSQLTAKDKKLAISLWGEDIVNRYLNWDDSKDRSKEIFGAGLFKVSGNSIKIRFSNELGSAWATFSTTIPKLAFEGQEPVKPEMPTTVINWHPSELVLNKNSNVHIHYIDVHEEAKNGITDFDHVGLKHGFEITDQLQSHTHLAIGDNYENELWDWLSANYILATETHDEEAEKGIVPEDDKHVYVYLKRKTEIVKRDKEVSQIIHYVYEDGTTAAPDYVRNGDNKKWLVFTQTGIKDLVTGETNWNGEWTLTQIFETVKSPIIEGYTTDRLEVGPYKITVDNSKFDENLDKEDTVVYKANSSQTTTPPDQPTDPSNPTNPTTPDQPTVPDNPTNPTSPSQPTIPENPTVPEETETVTPNPEETPKETETVTPHPSETPSEEKKKKTVTPKSQENRDTDETTSTVTNVSVTEDKTQNVVNSTEDDEATLPETGSKETSQAGVVGLIAAAIGSLLGLAGDRKRKKDN